jgi:saccharopine dehydrogenase-like NADP-dependent oxidoreductase
MSDLRILCLGGAGRICREAALDFTRHYPFGRITIADAQGDSAREVAEWLNAPGVDSVQLDVQDQTRAVQVMRDFDLVIDGTPISLNDASTACIAKAGVNGLNLNGMSREWELDSLFRASGRTHVPGVGMTPGTTNLMAMHAASQLDSVEIVRCSHGAFRPIAFSKAIAETTRIEYDPVLPGRVVFEDGEFVQVPPFARPMEIKLPPPFGTHYQYIIPHPEPLTLSRSLAGKGIRLVEARGTWPPRNMRLLAALHEWGMLRNDKVKVEEHEVGVLDAIFAHCLQSPEGQTTELYGYALHVEVVGSIEGQRQRHVLTHTHPPSDGSVPEWAGLRAYTRNVGIPLSIGAWLISQGKCPKGVLSPEEAFDPAEFFAELRRREIFIHESTIDWP